jgi:uncharacterized cupin superfamily protein
MSLLLTRAGDAEVLDMGAGRMQLLADHDTTHGALNANRAVLQAGTAGSAPHYHHHSAEMFFVLGGALRALAGDRVLTLDEGDFLLVPRGMTHAFSAEDGSPADVLVVFTPAIPERFAYFRLGERVLRGEASPREILENQDRFDNHFVRSPHWPTALPGA